VDAMNNGNGTSIEYLYRNPENVIYALGWGFYRSTIPVFTEIENYPEQNNSITALNAPNPFNSFTQITWNKTDSKEIIISIISAASSSIVFKERIINTGNFLFRASDLMPGIYYYSISDENKLYSGKMVLLK
jgi:hypothetical protein